MVTRMGLNDILKRIKIEHKKEIREIERERNRKLREMKREAKKEVDGEREELRREFDKELEIYRNLKLSEAKRAVRQSELKEKEKMINLTLEKIEEHFINLRGERYRALLKNMVAEALDILGGRCEIRAARKEDIPFLKRLGSAPVAEKTVEGIGGVVLVSSDGDFRIDRTFDYLLSKRKAELRKMIAEILFKEER